MRRILLSIVSAILFVSVGGAQEVKQMSLKECTEYALKHNYTVKNAQIDVLIQKAQNNELLSASYPHINGKADFTDFYVPTSSFVDQKAFNPAADHKIIPISFTVPYSSSAGVTASQLLFDGAVFIALKARNSVMEMARNNEAVTEETVRYNVYKAYNSLVIAYRQYDIIKNSLGYARSLEHDLEITRLNGFAEKIDVERTSVQVNNLATDSIRIGNMLKVSEQVLKYQIGMDMNTQIVLNDTGTAQRREAALSLLAEEKNYERVPEYVLLNTTMKLNEYNLRRYKLSALPTFNTYWAYGVNYGTDDFWRLYANRHDWMPNSTIGIQMNLPIYNGSLRANQVHEAKLNIEKNKNNIDFMKQTIDFQVEMYRTTLKNTILQVQSQRRNMELAADVLDLAQRKYKAGVGSNLEVTQAQTDQLRAQTGYFSALLDLINAEADLKKALGLLK